MASRFLLVLLAYVSAVLSWFGRGGRSRAPHPPPAAIAHTWKNRIAVHEAGHAVAAWSWTLAVNVQVRTEKADGGGEVTYDRLIGNDPAATLWGMLVIKLAGVAAELFVFRVFRAKNAESDLAMALSIAGELVGIGAGERYARESCSFFFERVYSDTLEPAELRVLNAAYLQAKALVVNHDVRYWRLVSLLLACGNVTEKQMETVLGTRAPVAFLRKLGVTTFVGSGYR